MSHFPLISNFSITFFELLQFSNFKENSINVNTARKQDRSAEIAELDGDRWTEFLISVHENTTQEQRD